MLIAITGGSPLEFDIPRRQVSFYQLGESLLHWDIPLIVATPDGVHPSSKRVQGWIFEGGEEPWQQIELPMEKHVVAFDAMYLADVREWSSTYRGLRHRLRARGIPLFNPSLPAKDTVFQRLEQVELGIGEVPPTKYDLSPGEVITLTKFAPGLWLKPTNGSGGQNILFVRFIKSGSYFIQGDRFFGKQVCREIDPTRLLDLLNHTMARHKYLVQHDIQLVSTTDERKVDFRVTVQRNHTGHWHVTAVTARLGPYGSLLTNYHAGGSICSLTNPTDDDLRWLDEVGIASGELAAIRKLALRVARSMQRRHPLLAYLGIDVGKSRDGRWYVYDCNGRPGRDILTDAEVERFMQEVAGFGAFLLHRHGEPETVFTGYDSNP